jgi:hypothetical protein
MECHSVVNGLSCSVFRVVFRTVKSAVGVEQPPQEDSTVNNLMDGSLISLAFALVVIVTSSIWLPKKLVLQAMHTPSTDELSHRGELPDESGVEPYDTQTPYR